MEPPSSVVSNNAASFNMSEETLAIESLMSMKQSSHCPTVTSSTSGAAASRDSEKSIPVGVDASAAAALLSRKKAVIMTTPPPPAGPSAQELAELKTSRAKSALKSWYRRLNELYQFKLLHGHCDVPQKYPENRCLGIWVNKQRCEKVMYEENADHKTNLTPRKLYELEKIGFVWAKRKGDVIWNQRYNELLEFYQENGHSNLPCKYKPKPTLGRWVTSQRSMYKRGTLPAEYVEKLDSIGFTWDMYAKPNSSEGDAAGTNDSNDTNIIINNSYSQEGGNSSVVSSSDQEKEKTERKKKKKKHSENVSSDDNKNILSSDADMGKSANDNQRSNVGDGDNSTITEVTDDEKSTQSHVSCLAEV